MAKKTFTLYLAKTEQEEFEPLLSDGARQKLGTAESRVFELADFADGGRLYAFVGPPHPPVWLRDLRAYFELDLDILARSACAVLFFRVSGRIFAATFAHGRMYLSDRFLERDFGLRASINALDEKRLKRLDRTNLGDALRGSSLSPFQREFNSFGLDDALDLVRAVSGNTKEDITADALTGSYALKINGEFGLEDLPALAEESIELFQSDDYQDTTFSILDILRPINDRDKIDELDGEAARSIRDGESNFELGLPAHSSEEGISYQFQGPRLIGRHPDLLLATYRSAMSDRLDEIVPETLKSHRIVACYDEDGIPNQRWSIHSALVGSIIVGGELYAINEGAWYQLDQAFKDSIEQDFQAVVQGWENPPRPLQKIYDDRGREGRFETESVYNESIADDLGYFLLDQKLVQVPSIQHSPFEICDLLDVEDKRFIHVKKSSRRSSVLSHFFKQGSNSAQILQSIPACWDNLRAIVARDYGNDARDRLDEAINDDRPWSVEFWIADSPRAGTNEFNIPFFSKISLRDEVSELQARQFEVALRFIRLNPDRRDE